MTRRIAIIGAGVAGLAAARRLREQRPDLQVTVYEQSQSLGGRVATHRRGEFAFDHGAQYLKASTPELERLIQTELPSDELFDIARPVWTFNGAGTIAEGDPAQNADPKWSYWPGLDLLGELLGTGLTIRREAQIVALQRPTTDNRPSSTVAQPATSRPQHYWALIDTQGQVAGEADSVLLTAPGPQTAELITASELPEIRRTAIVAELRRVIYRHCLSCALAYHRLIARPFYALVNIDRAHPISWLALEHEKGPLRCPPGHSLLIAQMAPQWSVEHWEHSIEQITPLVASLVGDLLSEDLDEPLWCDRQSWRFALPDGRANIEVLEAPELGLFFAGDYTAGQGRVHLAIEQGWQAAERLLASG